VCLLVGGVGEISKIFVVMADEEATCPAASCGGALVLLAVMTEPCLSKYDNILLMMAGSVIHAIIATLCFWHFSHSVISMLNTRFKRWAHVMPYTWMGSSE
jgi:hypothetical protein